MMQAIRLLSLGLLVAAAAATAQGQGDSPFSPKFNLSGDFGAESRDSDPLAFSAQLYWAEGEETGRLEATGEVADRWHVYSVTQPPGGPKRTRLEVEGEGLELLGPFQPTQPPHRTESDVWQGVTVEEHDGTVTWVAPVRRAAGTAAEAITATVTLSGQVCSDAGTCLPVEKQAEAGFAGFYQPPEALGRYRGQAEHVFWEGWLEPAEVAPGESATLVFRATPDDDYHVYPVADDADGAEQVTRVVMTHLSGLRAARPEADSAPVEVQPHPSVPPVLFHEGAVTWRIPVTVPADAEPGRYPIKGMIGYQTCTLETCDPPLGVAVSTHLEVGGDGGRERRPVGFEAAGHAEVVAAEEQTGPWAEQPERAAGRAAQAASPYGLPAIIALALLGGLILNVMPCVLPVIGLKVMALVDGSGDDRRRAMVMNVWYVIGILTVFWLLAALAVAFRKLAGETFMWGEQFTYEGVNIALAAVVFALALAFLGIWEIPVPGFATSSQAGELQRREGPLGAFFKGVFTTILATPCSGPGLGVAFAYTATQPVAMTPIVFTAVGLGMGMPFLLLGLYPGLMRWMPRPGPWMDTFKQLLAFLLLGTVVWLFAGIGNDYRVPTLALLFGVWFACWVVGRVPPYAEVGRRLMAWAGGIAVAVAVGMGSFHYLARGEEVLPWEPYSEARLAELQSQGKTVLIDFTADWCANCLLNYNVAINTEEVAEVVAENDVVPLIADWSDGSPQIKAKLAELDSASIPLLAIYPGDAPNEPIVLPDLLTRRKVVEALRAAGPSRDTSSPGGAGPAVARAGWSE